MAVHDKRLARSGWRLMGGGSLYCGRNFRTQKVVYLPAAKGKKDLGLHSGDNGRFASAQQFAGPP